MNTSSTPLRQQIFHAVIIGVAIVKQRISSYARKIRLMFLYLRAEVVIALKDPRPVQPKQSKVLAIIPHITSADQSQDSPEAALKIEKLKHTIDGLLTSFAHCELSILIRTLPGRHITASLPDYQKRCIQVITAPDCDPMYLGFQVQDEFVQQREHFDWFLFLEDDIVIQDSLLLEKLEQFNQFCGYKNALLLPNRYEMWEGVKNYIDLTIDTRIAWNKLSEIEIDGVKYAECTNPHAAVYCLSQSQLQHWIKSGQRWKSQNLMVSPLESAATFCLLECFRLYKPHPANLHYFEVKHFDTKYSRLYADPSPYILSAQKAS